MNTERFEGDSVAEDNAYQAQLDRMQANARITTALNTLRINGWTTEQREALVNGLHREDAVEAAERAVAKIGNQA